MEEHPRPTRFSYSNWLRNHPNRELFVAKWDDETDDWYLLPGEESTEEMIKLRQDALAAIEKSNKNDQEIKEWQDLDSYERYFQWRQFYALKMCSL